MRAKVVGLDPGKWTAWFDGKEHGFIETDDPNVLSHFAESLDVDAVYIEGAFVHKTKTNFNHIINHCIRIGRLAQAFGAIGVRVVIVPSMTWKSQVLAVGGVAVINNTAAQKAAAIKAAKMLGFPTKDHNIADAVCIQYYGSCQEQRKEIK